MLHFFGGSRVHPAGQTGGLQQGRLDLALSSWASLPWCPRPWGFPSSAKSIAAPEPSKWPHQDHRGGRAQ